MKRVFSGLLVLPVLIGLTACGEGGGDAAGRRLVLDQGVAVRAVAPDGWDVHFHENPAGGPMIWIAPTTEKRQIDELTDGITHTAGDVHYLTVGVLDSCPAGDAWEWTRPVAEDSEYRYQSGTVARGVPGSGRCVYVVSYDSSGGSPASDLLDEVVAGGVITAVEQE